MATARKSVADTIIDFTKEEQGGGGGIRVKEGTYHVKVIKAVPTVSAEKGTEGLAVTFQFQSGKYRGKKIIDTLWVSPKAYSRFRTLLEACGAPVPKRIKLSSIGAAVKGAELFIEIQDEEREGYSTRSRVTFEGFISMDDMDPNDAVDDDDEDVEDEDLDDDELEDEDEETEGDDLDDLDRSELKAKIKADELDVTVKKSMTDDDIRDAMRAVMGDEDEEEEFEEEEDEEPEPPKRRRGTSKTAAKPAGRTRRRKKPAEEEDLDELDLDAL